MKSWINRQLALRLLGCVVCTLFVTHAVSYANDEVPSEENHPPGPLELDGGYVGDWSDWYGKWVLIAYYAEWCFPCYEEITLLNELHKEREKHDVVVIGINFDEKRGEDLQAVKRKMKVEFPSLLEDPSDRWNKQKPEVLPVTYVINPSGKLEEVLTGIQDKKSLLKAID